MKYLKYFEKINFNRFDEYERAKNSPEYKALIEGGYIDTTSRTERGNGTFSFKAPRGAKYAIDRFYGGRINYNGRVFHPSNTKNPPKSYEEAFTRLLKLKNRSGYILNSHNYYEDKHEYIKNFIKRLSKNKSYIMNLDFIPSLEEHPELIPLFDDIFKSMKRYPLAYLPYFKFVADGDKESRTTLSEDLLYMIEEIPKEEMEKIENRMVKGIENNPTKWVDEKKFKTLPISVQEKLKWLKRSKNLLWSLKK